MNIIKCLNGYRFDYKDQAAYEQSIIDFIFFIMSCRRSVSACYNKTDLIKSSILGLGLPDVRFGFTNLDDYGNVIAEMLEAQDHRICSVKVTVSKNEDTQTKLNITIEANILGFESDSIELNACVNVYDNFVLDN